MSGAVQRTTSFQPRDGAVAGTVDDSTPEQIEAAVAAAANAAATVAGASPAQRRAWLESLAATLETHSDELIELVGRETGFGVERLRGELARAASQLRFYGAVAEEGAYLRATVDGATETSPRLVRVNRPLGPVAVFGASNFPFGFGVLGNDTASALAAGCPVVVKAHPAHVLSCVRLAELAGAALAGAGAPAGAFGMVIGWEAGVRLVKAPGIKAVGFTGSQGGGLALWRIANEREEVIPVYAEMGTVNPVVLTRAGAARIDEVAKGFVGSFTLGSGQFCTKPGLLLAPAGHNAAELVAKALEAAAPEPVMLTKAIAGGVTTGIDEMVAAGARLVARVTGPGKGWSADAAVLAAPVEALTRGSRLLEECFGPVVVVVEYADSVELETALSALQGSLAGAVFTGGETDQDASRAVEWLARQVGRVTANDWPTGVAWTWAQQHGGPWPATSNPASTSVGAAALDRFVRPVTFQSIPDAALPNDVRPTVAADNPWRIPRRIDGALIAP